MKRNLTVIPLTLAALALGGTVLADSGYGTGHHELPKRGENTHSGDTMNGHFDHIDRNDDGVVSRDEVETHDDRDQWYKRKALLQEFANPGF